MIASGSGIQDGILTTILVHPFYHNKISLSCDSADLEMVQNSSKILNYSFNPSTEIFSIFIRNRSDTLVSTSTIESINRAFGTNNTVELANSMCNFTHILHNRITSSGIALGSNVFLLSNENRMPTIVEPNEEPYEVYWNPSLLSPKMSDRMIFVSSDKEGKKNLWLLGEQNHQT